jgi:hypothetical protein
MDLSRIMSAVFLISSFGNSVPLEGISEMSLLPEIKGVLYVMFTFDNSLQSYYCPHIILIISLLMSPLLGHRPYGFTHKENGP